MLSIELLNNFCQVNKKIILDHGECWAKLILIPPENSQWIQVKKELLNDLNIQNVVYRLNDPILGIPSLSRTPADYRIYGSFYWGLLFLADLGLTAEELHITEMIRNLQLQQLEDGQFIIRYHRKKQQTISLVCMTAHLTYCLIRLGYKDSSTVNAAMKFILTTQRKDGGWHCDRLKQIGEKNESAPSCLAANIHIIRVLGQYDKKFEQVVRPAVSQLLDSWNTGAILGCEFETNQKFNPIKLRYPPHYIGLDILNVVHSLSFYSALLNNSQFENLISSILNRWDGINWLRPEKRIPEWSAFDFSQKTGFSSWITSLFLQTIERVYFKN